MNDRYGLIGKVLKHSFSPEIHRNFGNYEYDLIEISSEEELEALIKDDSYKGFNVTIPYKKSVIKHCDELSERAKLSGAVNTIVKGDDGIIRGDNTDVYGFEYLIKDVDVSGKVLVLGSGGASGAVITALKELKAGEIVTISRSGVNNYKNLNKHHDAQVIVNTTPVGMYPNNGESPIENLGEFKELKVVVELIYNPYKTKLLLDAEEMGVEVKSGLPMLVAQAKKAGELWQGLNLSDDLIEKVYLKLLRKTQNIMLIGMPGSGKSSVAKALGKALNKPYLDLDKQVVRHMGMAIQDVFGDPNLGEEYFRKNETEVLEEVSKETGYIIATGGGAVTRKENWPLLKQNGICIYIKRDVNLLSQKGRPLSKSKGVKAIYKERAKTYESLADIAIENNRSFEGSYFTELNEYAKSVKDKVDKYYNGKRGVK